MLKYYRMSQQIQHNWIRNHPVQYVALNATLLAAVFGYSAYKDRKDRRAFENEITQQEK
jgi:hypothetical protein